MAKGVEFFIPGYENFEDYRDGIPGDSYTNAFPFFYNAGKNFQGIAVHHTAGPDTQKPDDIAWYHINSRGWAGIGYHFLVDKDGKILYVGDLGTGRAHVASHNEKYIGICMIGSFMDGKVPTDKQLQAVHLLCKEFIENEPTRFPNVNNWDMVKGHGDIEDQSTSCPGSTHDSWWNKIKFGVPTTPDPTPPGDCEEQLENLKQKIKDALEESERKDNKINKLNDEIFTLNNKLTDKDKWMEEFAKQAGNMKEHTELLQKSLSEFNANQLLVNQTIQTLKETAESFTEAQRALQEAWENIHSKQATEIDNLSTKLTKMTTDKEKAEQLLKDEKEINANDLKSVPGTRLFSQLVRKLFGGK